MTYQLFIDDKSDGPYTADQIRTKLEAGAIGGDTPVWSEGWEDWLPVSEVAELNQIPADAATSETGQNAASDAAAKRPKKRLIPVMAALGTLLLASVFLIKGNRPTGPGHDGHGGDDGGAEPSARRDEAEISKFTALAKLITGSYRMDGIESRGAIKDPKGKYDHVRTSKSELLRAVGAKSQKLDSDFSSDLDLIKDHVLTEWDVREHFYGSIFNDEFEKENLKKMAGKGMALNFGMNAGLKYETHLKDLWRPLLDADAPACVVEAQRFDPRLKFENRYKKSRSSFSSSLYATNESEKDLRDCSVVVVLKAYTGEQTRFSYFIEKWKKGTEVRLSTGMTWGTLKMERTVALTYWVWSRDGQLTEIPVVFDSAVDRAGSLMSDRIVKAFESGDRDKLKEHVNLVMSVLPEEHKVYKFAQRFTDPEKAYKMEQDRFREFLRSKPTLMGSVTLRSTFSRREIKMGLKILEVVGEGMGRGAIRASTFPPKTPNELVPFSGGLVEKGGILELVLVPAGNKGHVTLQLYQDKLTGKGTDGGVYEFKIEK